MPKTRRRGGATRNVGESPLRVRRALTSDEKVAIAMARFAPLREGGSYTSLQELGTRFDRDPAVVSRAIVSAFKEGLVELRKKDAPTPPSARNTPLEQALLDRFPRLQTARVIHANGGVGDGTDKIPRDEKAEGDRIHRRLGETMAVLISEPHLFRRNDVVGLGSGRGVYYVVEALGRRPRIRVSGVKLISLSGNVFPEAHSEELDLLLDADIHVALMGLRFAQPVALRTISYPIVRRRPKAARDLDDFLFSEVVPNHMLAGVGVLGPGHRFYEYVKGQQKDSDSSAILQPIEHSLTKLVDLSDRLKNEESGYFPIGDICNRLFVVPPPSGVAVKSRSLADLQALAEQVNDRLLTIDDEQLRDIENIMLVAGTRSKALAIKRLLMDDNLRIRVLCTDEPAAQLITRD